MSIRSITAATWAIRFSCIAALVGAGCSTQTSAPTAPTPAPAPAPAPAPPPATASIQITIEPNPVPFSGVPITDAASCASSRNTWFYDQVFKETGGAAVTFTARVDKFDDSPVQSQTGISVPVPANGTLTWHSRWCSAAATAHTAQTTWTGVDANGHSVSVTGPVARLMAR